MGMPFLKHCGLFKMLDGRYGCERKRGQASYSLALKMVTVR
jgi:hypothetical protein